MRANEKVDEILSTNFVENKEEFFSVINKLRKPRKALDGELKVQE